MNTQSFAEYDNNVYKAFTSKAEIERDIRVLVGILKGIKCDKEVSGEEILGLKGWLQSIQAKEQKQPYGTIVEVINNSLEDNVLTKDEIESILWYCNHYLDESGYYDIVTASVQKLLGIVKGIAIDKKINEQELFYLNNWLEDHSYLKRTWPYDELYALITWVLVDKKMNEEEHKMLLNFCESVSSNNSTNNEGLVNSIKQGYCHIDPVITIAEQTFCITGISKKYKRKEIAERIELYGGIVVNNVSSKLNYLVICDEKNACWAFTAYGRKVEEAINLRKNGKHIIIANEYDLYDAFESLS